MHGLKKILFGVSLCYFVLGLLFELLVLTRSDFLASLFGEISEGLGGLLIAGFLALFLGTILVNSKTEKSPPDTPQQAPRNSKKLSIPGLLHFIFLVNFGFSFFSFAAVTSGNHGTPEIYGGRYVMAYRGEVIKVIDKETYYRELRINQERTARLFGAVVLFFTWGAFAANLPGQTDSERR